MGGLLTATTTTGAGSVTFKRVGHPDRIPAIWTVRWEPPDGAPAEREGNLYVVFDALHDWGFSPEQIRAWMAELP